MKKYFFILSIISFFALTSNCLAQNDTTSTEKNQTFISPIHKGAFTLGGDFRFGENTQALQAGVGYFFTDRLGLAVDALLLEDVLAVQILPRYYFPILDNTYLFVEMGVNLNNSIYVTGGAGVTYFLNERVGIQGRLNNFNGGGIGLFVLFPGKSERNDN